MTKELWQNDVGLSGGRFNGIDETDKLNMGFRSYESNNCNMKAIAIFIVGKLPAGENSTDIWA